MIHDLRTASSSNDDVLLSHVRDAAAAVLYTHFDDDLDDTITYAVLRLDSRDTDDTLSIYYADAATTNADAYDPNRVPDAVRRVVDTVFAH